MQQMMQPTNNETTTNNATTNNETTTNDANKWCKQMMQTNDATTNSYKQQTTQGYEYTTHTLMIDEVNRVPFPSLYH